MKTVTVHDLQNSFSKVETWMMEGENICLQKNGQPLGLLTPWLKTNTVSFAKPDFAARRKAIWGERVFSETEVSTMRADE